MAHFISRSTLNWTLVLLSLLVTLAGPWLDAPRGVSATALASPLQARTSPAGSTSSEAVQGLQPNLESPQIPLSDKQRREMLKANFDRMKRDAKELADLAKNLQDQLDKSNENVLSLGIVDKADKIEKLARKIKSTARGF
jgi:thioesterase domain-containing protein